MPLASVPAAASRSFATAGEDWPDYTEEMMWEIGLGAGDPEVRVGQLRNART